MNKHYIETINASNATASSSHLSGRLKVKKTSNLVPKFNNIPQGAIKEALDPDEIEDIQSILDIMSSRVSRVDKENPSDIMSVSPRTGKKEFKIRKKIQPISPRFARANKH